MEGQLNRKNVIYCIHVMIMLGFMLGFKVLPAPEPITPLGMNILGIFIGLLWGWSFLDMVVPSLFAAVMVGFTGILGYPDCKAVFMAHFNNDSLIFIIFILIFVALLTELNVVEYVANWIVSRKSLHGKPWLTSFFILLGVLIMGMIAQPFPAIFLFWGVTYKICDMYGYKKGETWPTVMLIGICVAAILAMVSCPYRAYVIILMTSYANATGGAAIPYAQYFMYSLPIALILLSTFILTCKYIIKVDVTKIANIEIDKIVKKEKATYEQKVGLIALFSFLLILFAPTFLPKTWGITMFLNKIGSTGTCILAIAILLVLRHDGRAVVDLQKAASKGVSWEIIMLSFVIITFTSYLTHASTGISAFLTLHMGELLGGLNPLALMISLAVIAAFLTNVANNVVVGSVLIVIGCSLGSLCGANLTLMSIMITFGAVLGFLTPAATPFIAVAFANKDWLRATDIYKYGVIIMVAFILVYCVVGYLWGCVIF